MISSRTRKHVQALASRYKALTEICAICHDSEPKYFVSDDVRGMVEAIQAALDDTPVNKARIGELVQQIGMESCFKCHLVHVPSAYSKY
jgi:hypothetical protein